MAEIAPVGTAVEGQGAGARQEHQESQAQPEQHDFGEQQEHQEHTEHHESLWGALREKMVAFGTMNREMRLITGFALAQLLVAAILIATRGLAQPLLVVDGQVGAATRMPVSVFAACLGFYLLSWAFLIAGALHMHWAARLAVMGLFSSMLWIFPMPDVAQIWRDVALGLLWLWIGALWFAEWRAARGGQPKPGWARLRVSALIATLCVGMVYLALYVTAARLRDPLYFAQLISLQLKLLAFALVPVLFLAGSDFAELGQMVSERAAEAAKARPRWALPLVTALLAGYAVWKTLPDPTTNVMAWIATTLWQLALGALLVAAIIALVWPRGMAHWQKAALPPLALVAAVAVTTLAAGLAIEVAINTQAGTPTAIDAYHVFAAKGAGPQFSIAYPADWQAQDSGADHGSRIVIFNGVQSDHMGLGAVAAYPLAQGPADPKDYAIQMILGQSCAHSACAITPDGQRGPWRATRVAVTTLTWRIWTRTINGNGWVVMFMTRNELAPLLSSSFDQMIASWRPDGSAQAPEPYAARAERAAELVGRLQPLAEGALPCALGLGIGIVLLRRFRDRGGPFAVAGVYAIIFGLLTGVYELQPLLDSLGVPFHHLAFTLTSVQLTVGVASLALVALTALRPHVLGERGTETLALLLALNGGLIFVSWMYALYGQAMAAGHELSIAQAVILVLALGWDLLMSGEQITNHDTRAFPRAARLLLYCGYIMLVAVAVTYFSSQAPIGDAKDFEPFFESEQWPQLGVLWLGAPLVLTGFFVAAGRVWRGGQPPTPPILMMFKKIVTIAS